MEQVVAKVKSAKGATVLINRARSMLLVIVDVLQTISQELWEVWHVTLAQAVTVLQVQLVLLELFLQIVLLFIVLPYHALGLNVVV